MYIIVRNNLENLLIPKFSHIKSSGSIPLWILSNLPINIFEELSLVINFLEQEKRHFFILEYLKDTNALSTASIDLKCTKATNA